MSRPGDFPTDITGVGDIVGDVIRFNVCHYVCLSFHTLCIEEEEEG